ncbi:MAG: CBS domain-containing protein [Saprospiraceae bacterium]|nr:CBS domain-containing protein [Saprospiraceae bacterium]
MSIKKRELVTHIMTKQPMSVSLRNSVEEVYELMHENCIRHVPVVNGNKLIGIVSKTDLERVSFAESSDTGKKLKISFYAGFTIEQIMTKNVQTLEVDDSVKDAAEMLSFGNFHAVPVVDGENLVAIVTTTDVINYLLEMYS